VIFWSSLQRLSDTVPLPLQACRSLHCCFVQYLMRVFAVQTSPRSRVLCLIFSRRVRNRVMGHLLNHKDPGSNAKVPLPPFRRFVYIWTAAVTVMEDAWIMLCSPKRLAVGEDGTIADAKRLADKQVMWARGQEGRLWYPTTQTVTWRSSKKRYTLHLPVEDVGEFNHYKY
jgi:hypothetical protein